MKSDMLKKVLLFGGVSESHALLNALLELPLILTLSVATDYGLSLLPRESERLALICGPLDAPQMKELMREGGFCAVIDATHPYAVRASAHISEAANATGLPCMRLLREESDLAGCRVVDSIEAAAAELDKHRGPALLTTGSKDIQLFSSVRGYKKRLYARVLPTTASLAACLRLGLPQSHIIAMQGPFSVALNVAMLREFNIRTIVSKDGGAAGGFPAKLAAARETGVELIAVRRPVESGLSMEELLRQLAILMGVE